MKRFGLICPPVTGHMHTMFALGRELARRGHHVTVISHSVAREKAELAELEFQPIAGEVPADDVRAQLAQLSTLSGREALVHIVEMGVPLTASLVRELPELIRINGLDALVIDEMLLPVGAVADAVGTPFIVVCSALPGEFGLEIPPCGANLDYRTGISGRLRNLVAYGRIFWQTRQPVMEIFRLIKPLGSRSMWGLAQWQSRLATIAQIPEEFDFPQRRRDTFHYAGPFIDPALRAPARFPFEKLDGRPLVFASLGTLMNGDANRYRTIAAACEGLEAQLVIAMGSESQRPIEDLPGNPLVVGFAPQLEILKRTSVMITHAGLNSVMEALACGVPLVAIPLASDQPGVAARLSWHGAGERILPDELTVERLREAVRRVLGDPAYREQAVRLQRAIEGTGGARRGAEIVETALAAAG